MSEKVKDLQASMKSWSVDIGNLKIRHQTGLTVKFEFSHDGACTGRVIDGYPTYDEDPETAKLQAKHFERLLLDAGRCFNIALMSHRH